jgi:hypothetical protein
MIIPSRSTAILGFVAGTFDMTFPYRAAEPLLNGVQNQPPRRSATWLRSASTAN